jgi:hypothetical protein
MESSSAPDQASRLDNTAQSPTFPSVNPNDSYSANAQALLSVAPRRVETARQDLYPARPSTEKYSSLSSEEVNEKKRALEEQLDRDEKLPRQPYTRHRADVSDSHPNGPWARKIILCLGKSWKNYRMTMQIVSNSALDGGGIKGYFSLLVLKRFISIIEEFEKGLRPYTLVCQG